MSEMVLKCVQTVIYGVNAMDWEKLDDFRKQCQIASDLALLDAYDQYKNARTSQEQEARYICREEILKRMKGSD